MNNELLSKMETDMRLFRFYDEPEAKYIARVIYSGMAMWMKAIALDGMNEIDKQPSSISKNHHTTRADCILKQFLAFAPDAIDWFYDDNSLDKPLFPIHLLQERLLRSGEIDELGFTNRIMPVLPTKVAITDTLARCKGLHNGIHAQYNGITSVIEEKLDAASKNTFVETLDFAEKFLHSANLTPDTQSREKEYFDPYVKTDTFYQSWEQKIPECNPYLSRVETSFQQYHYFVESNENGITKSCRIDDYMVASGNLLRLLLVFRSRVFNPISVTITHYPHYFKLKRYVKSFPYPEEATLQAIGWPINSISDNLNYCYHSYMLPVIKSILGNLLMNINEVSYERPI